MHLGGWGTAGVSGGGVGAAAAGRKQGVEVRCVVGEDKGHFPDTFAM